MTVRFGLLGVGSIGLSLVNKLDPKSYELVCAVDTDPSKAGKTVRDLGGPPESDVEVVQALRREAATACDVFVQTTTSRFESAYQDLVKLASWGCDVVSTCEELSYPFLKYPELSSALHSVAQDSDSSVLGTGINPGFLMDALPSFLSTACSDVTAVNVTRRVDASRRREPLQRKVGLGLAPETFKQMAEDGRLGHVGLFESCALVADSLGWSLSRIDQNIEPLLAERDMRTNYFKIPKGCVRGLRQTAVAKSDAGEISMCLEMAVGTLDVDEVRIEGKPRIRYLAEGGVHGDVATISRLIYGMDVAPVLAPGLLTVLDIPTSRSLRRQKGVRLEGNASRL